MVGPGGLEPPTDGLKVYSEKLHFTLYLQGLIKLSELQCGSLFARQNPPASSSLILDGSDSAPGRKRIRLANLLLIVERTRPLRL